MKNKLTISINFVSLKVAEEELVMHLNSYNNELMIYDNTNNFVDKLKSLLSRYQNDLETSIRGSYFVFDSVLQMYEECHNINLDVVVHILILQIRYKRKKQQ